jgi:hypothetical protein
MTKSDLLADEPSKNSAKLIIMKGVVVKLMKGRDLRLFGDSHNKDVDINEQSRKRDLKLEGRPRPSLRRR